MRFLRLDTSFSKLSIISSASCICFLENSKARSARKRNVLQSKHMQIPLHPLVCLLSIPFFGDSFLGERPRFSKQGEPLCRTGLTLLDIGSMCTTETELEVSSTVKGVPVEQ
ncbi:Os01g0101850 [Oryza sativa Japonica Group]|uniref:Os01g0101850 protein n=1 Tax=Oryza sativa subsp. japonica TaxID=39947 RepID=A0A0P0UX22_ORYSJ|nr:Os01g0101850 [Oryza sativa Japonica Group]